MVTQQKCVSHQVLHQRLPHWVGSHCTCKTFIYSLYISLFILPPTTEIVGVYWSQQMVGQMGSRSKFMSQTPASTFNSSKWNMIHMLPIKVRGEWYQFFKALLSRSRVIPPFLFRNSHIEKVFVSNDFGWFAISLVTTRVV